MSRLESITHALKVAYEAVQAHDKMPVTVIKPIVITKDGEFGCKLAAIEPDDSDVALSSLAETWTDFAYRGGVTTPILAVGVRSIRPDTAGGHTHIVHFDSPI